MTDGRFTVLVLCYGPFAWLAKRCLESVYRGLPHPAAAGVRIGLNQVAPATEAVVADLVERHPEVPTLVDASSRNRLKYPVLRDWIHGAEPVTTEFVMWFDDDSFVRPQVSDFYGACQRQMQQADVASELWQCRLGGAQPHWIRNHASWYNCKDVQEGQKVEFAIGGWWCARTAVLRDNDWPPAVPFHNGGDVLFGELCRQREYRLVRFNPGVAINADRSGRGGRMPRRGHSEAPLGWNAQPEEPSA
jgi:hypothetical protein